jgi:hypothetical protein
MPGHDYFFSVKMQASLQKVQPWVWSLAIFPVLAQIENNGDSRTKKIP